MTDEFNILAADDDAGILELLKDSLSRDYTMHLAPDGAIALNIFREKKIDMIILDISMPKMNGIDVIRNIRENDDVAIVVISGADDNSVQDSLLAGANFVLRKPFNLSHLHSLTKVVADSRR